MENRYFDYLFKEIKNSNLHEHNEYYKFYLDEFNEIKFNEIIEKNIVVGLDYYIENELISEIINQNKKLNYITFYTNKKTSGIYRKYDVILFNKEIKHNIKRIQVYKGIHFPIYDCAIDSETGEVKHLSKNYYNDENDLHYEFEYEMESGNLKCITVYDPYNYIDTSNHTILPNQVGIGKNDYGFEWNKFEYYKNATPILPH